MPNPSQIAQKFWNYCNVLPACRALLGVHLCLAGRQAGGRDDLSACDAQAGGMRYGDWPALLMNASAASADPLLRHAFVRRARRSPPRCTARVRLMASPLHAPVSRRGLALSPRTAMNNTGSIEQLTYLLFLKMADERTKRYPAENLWC